MFTQFQDVTVRHTHPNEPLRGLQGFIVESLDNDRYAVALYIKRQNRVWHYDIHKNDLAHSDCYQAIQEG